MSSIFFSRWRRAGKLPEGGASGRFQPLVEAPGLIEFGEEGVEPVHEEKGLRGKDIIVREIQRAGRDLDGLALCIHIGQRQSLGSADDGAGCVDTAEIINKQGAAVIVFR